MAGCDFTIGHEASGNTLRTKCSIDGHPRPIASVTVTIDAEFVIDVLSDPSAHS